MAETVNPEEFQALLLARRAELVGDSEQMRRDALPESGAEGGRTNMSTHLADVASDVQDQQFVIERLSTSSATLQQIDEALERVQAGRFGRCEECGQEIATRRLRIAPWACLCIACQRTEEAL